MSPSRDRWRARPRSLDSGHVPADGLGADDSELDTYLAALAPSAVETTGGFGSAKVFQLRLSARRIEQLRRIAAERGVSPGALAVDWVIDRLDRENTPTGPNAVVAEAERRRDGPLRGLRRRSS